MTLKLDIDPAQKKQVAILGVGLLVALVVVFISWSRTRASATTVPRVVDHAALIEQLSGEAEELAKAIQVKLERDAQPVAADWAAPVVVAPAARAAVNQGITFKLKGIASTGADAVAFVDDRTVSVGEAVDGYTLRSITAESATFVDGRGREFVLKVYED